MLNIIWTDDAVDDVLQNIDYLEKYCSKKVVDKFAIKIDAVLDKLSKGNLTFKSSKYKETYEVPIVKQITLYYQIQDNTILLIRFWNNYQNPEMLVID